MDKPINVKLDDIDTSDDSTLKINNVELFNFLQKSPDEAAKSIKDNFQSFDLEKIKFGTFGQVIIDDPNLKDEMLTKIDEISSSRASGGEANGICGIRCGWISMIEHIVSSILSPKLLNIIIFPTEKCNFRCTYCYEDFENGRMSRDTINGIKNLINNRATDIEKLIISWFGGEPLLAKDIIYEISNHIMSIKNSSLLYSANITTNAYLLDIKTFLKLYNCGISTFQISIDGIDYTHNKTRKLANGNDSFHKIIRNLRSIRDETDKDVKIILRLHYSMDNIQELPKTISFLKNEFMFDSRFKIYIKSLGKLGGKNDEYLNISNRNIHKPLLDILKNELDINNFLYNENNDDYICYASKANSFAIRSSGELSKCTVALKDPINLLGRINSDGSLQINREKMNFWLNGLKTGNLEMLACPYSKILSLKNTVKIPVMNI